MPETEDTTAAAPPEDLVEASGDAPEEKAPDGPASAEEDSAKLKDRLLRAMAELENLRRRTEREKQEIGKYAIAAFARDLVAAVDNLKRAEDNIPEEARTSEGALKTLWEGVDLTHRELLGVFERHGITRLNPRGEKFDHRVHQAVAQVDAEDVEPGTVVEVLQTGYVMFDRLLKPAMVTVARTPGASDDAPA